MTKNPQTEWLVKAMELAFQKKKGLWAHSMLDVLEGLTAEQAAWKPQKKGAHSIWETVHHALYWKHYLAQRLDGKTPPASDEESWVIKEKSAEAWAKTVARLQRSHNALLKHLKTGKIDLDKPLPGTKSKAGEMLFGALAHDCYHTGQIAVLRQLQGIGLQV